jgi:Zn-dependent peptidase ImmA (M78 family)
MGENINFNIDEVYEETNVDYNDIMSNFENGIFNDYESENIIASQILNYQMNFTIKQLVVICDYYGISKEMKLNKATKIEIINTLVYFENKSNNEDIVLKRQNLWFYLNELKNDKIMKKYVLW